jgi:hypothetical protein
MEDNACEPYPPAILKPQPVRHDGWIGDRMAIFLETLAGTGFVAGACRAAGMSRASAWRAAQAAAEADDRAEIEREREAWFVALRNELRLSKSA